MWEREFAAYTPWARLYFYWVDERCVPPTDAQSNFGLADRLLFSKINLPASHYYRIVGEGAPGEEAILYSSLVKATVPTVDDVPIFDFVLLGVGEDGHTSSVFPDRKDLLTAAEPYAVSVNPYNKTVRICMTGKPMIEAKHTCFLVAGENKCSILKKILDKEQEDKTPTIFTREIKKILRSVVCKLGNIKKVTDQFAHHLTGIIPAVIGKKRAPDNGQKSSRRISRSIFAPIICP